MAAVAFVALNLFSKQTGRNRRQRDVPIHLRGILTELDDSDPVSVVEGLARKDTEHDGYKVSKLTSHGSWLPTRLIATKDRLFLLKKAPAEDTYDIVDSIPLHQIIHLSKADIPKNVIESKHRGSDATSRPDNSEDASAPVQISESFIMKAKAAIVQSSGSDHQLHSSKALLGILNPKRTLSTESVTSSGIEIRTVAGGFNQGKVFFFDFDNEDHCEEWLLEFQDIVESAKVFFRRQHAVEYIQGIAKQIFDSDLFQFGIVLSTGANFALAILQAQVRDDNMCLVGDSATAQVGNQSYGPITAQVGSLADGPIKSAYDDLAILFTILFIVELLVNFVANAWHRFWHDKWNWFDVIIIVASTAVIFSNTTNNVLIKQTRILRSLRVARVFDRFGNIREIAMAISASIMPAANALLVGLIVVSIYSVIGREFYGREFPEYFCDFMHAFYTMFGVVALGTNPLPVFDVATGTLIVGNAVFMYSYVAVVVFVLLQVVVAVLLESFYKARQRSKEKAAAQAALQASLEAQAENALDGILEELAAAFDTGENLDRRLKRLFDTFDVDGTNAISFSEFSEGIFKAKQVRPQIEDYERMTDGGRLCNASQSLEFEHFRVIMRAQLKEFVQRKLAVAQFDSDIQGDMQTLLSAMKLVLLALERVDAGAAAAAARVEEQARAIQEDLTRHEYTMTAIHTTMNNVLGTLNRCFPAGGAGAAAAAGAGGGVGAAAAGSGVGGDDAAAAAAAACAAVFGDGGDAVPEGWVSPVRGRRNDRVRVT